MHLCLGGLWHTRCWFNKWRVLNALWQVEHLKSFVELWFIMWPCKLHAEANVLSHWGRDGTAIKTAWKKPVFIAGFYWFFSKKFWKKPVFIGFFQNFGFFVFVCYLRISFFLFILLYSIISYLLPFHLSCNQVRHMLIPTIKW